MVSYMRMVLDRVPVGVPLAVESRSLLAIGYKSWIGQHRSALHRLQTELLPVCQSSRESDKMKQYMHTHAVRLLQVCVECVALIRSRLLLPMPVPVSVLVAVGTGTPDPAVLAIVESNVFWNKLLGDCLRWLAELEQQPDTSDVVARSIQRGTLATARQAEAAYDAALDGARALPATNPVKLGLALNCSVFYNDILKTPDKVRNYAGVLIDNTLPGVIMTDVCVRSVCVCHCWMSLCRRVSSREAPTMRR
jgi:14-3-3 protein epsilon